MNILEVQKKYYRKVDPLEVDLFIAHILNSTKEFILSHPEYVFTKKQQLQLEQCISRRLKKEPFAYIIGHKEFFGIDFKVNRHTLIPRPETELLVEEIIKETKYTQTLKSSGKKTCIIDIGTGSGNIIISLAKHLTDSIFFGFDISKHALRLARANAKRHSVSHHITFKYSDLLENFSLPKKTLINQLIIAANLPYLSEDLYNNSMEDVRKYEPKSALYSQEQGLKHYKQLLSQINHLHGSQPQLPLTIFLEISPEQKKMLTSIIRTHLSHAHITFIKDFSKKWRLVKISLL